MNCTCEQPMTDCPEHGTGCDGRSYMRLKAERDAWREEADLLAEALEHECYGHTAVMAYRAFRDGMRAPALSEEQAG